MISSIVGVVIIIAGNIIFYFQSLKTLREESSVDLDYNILCFSDDFRSYSLSILFVGIGTYLLVDLELFKSAGFLLTFSSCCLIYIGFNKRLINPWASSRINRWYSILVFVELLFGIVMLVGAP